MNLTSININLDLRSNYSKKGIRYSFDVKHDYHYLNTLFSSCLLCYKSNFRF